MEDPRFRFDPCKSLERSYEAPGYAWTLKSLD